MQNNKMNSSDKDDGETIIDVLIDQENKEPITLTDSNGRQIKFDQIAVIPYDERLYCILKPIDKVENVSDNEAIVFYVEEPDEGDPILKVETDEKVAMEVFREYYELLDEENIKHEV